MAKQSSLQYKIEQSNNPTEKAKLRWRKLFNTAIEKEDHVKS